MLPMILSFLGSAFAPSIAAATGIGALASPLLTGAIGSGLGTLAQGGSPGDALRSGLGSFVGGKLVGGLMGGAAPGALNAPLAGQSTIGAGANAMTTGTPLSAAGGINSLMPPQSAAKPGLFGSGALGSGMRRGMDFAMSPTGIGSMVGSALATPQPTVRMDKKDSDAKKEMKPIPRQMLTPPEGYRPGIDAEFDYGISTPRSYEDILAYRDRGVLPYAEGGEVKQPNEKTEIVEAVAAIKNQHPQPEIALGKFLAKYGEEALRDLVESVRSGEFDETRERFANGENGVVRGPGDGSGVDDKVPATIDGAQDVLLSDGEFVLRKDATDALEKMFGGGFLSAVNSAGEAAPKVLKQKVAA
jgi:hypothetical protein